MRNLKTTLSIAILTAFWASCSSSGVKPDKAPDHLKVTCLGPENAKSYMIYLHGMASNSPSSQELSNRVVLDAIAKKRNIRIALPRAKMECPSQKNSICWAWKFDPSELAVLQTAVDSRTECFPEGKAYGMLGFSNGGYLITHAYAEGMFQSMKPAPAFLIASGSGKGQAPEEGADLSRSPRLTFVIGTKDEHNYDPTESFFYELQKLKNAPVQLIEFQGGHTLNEEAILNSLQGSPQI